MDTEFINTIFAALRMQSIYDKTVRKLSALSNVRLYMAEIVSQIG